MLAQSADIVSDLGRVKPSPASQEALLEMKAVREGLVRARAAIARIREPVA